VIAEFVSFLGYALLTRFVFHCLQAELGLWLVARINLAGFAASRLFSIGGIGGFVVTYQALAKRGVSRSIAVVAVATQQLFIYIVLWSIFFVALAYLIAQGRGSSGSTIFAVIAIAMSTTTRPNCAAGRATSRGSSTASCAARSSRRRASTTGSTTSGPASGR